MADKGAPMIDLDVALEQVQSILLPNTVKYSQTVSLLISDLFGSEQKLLEVDKLRKGERFASGQVLDD